MKTKKQQLSDEVSIVVMTAKSEHKFYTKDFKNRAHKFKNREEYQNFVRRFFEKIADHLIENPNGVLIKDLGYFFNFMLPNPKLSVKGNKFLMNMETAQHTYSISFNPTVEHLDWIMDKSFSKYVKKGVFRKLKSGTMRYKSHFYYLKKTGDIY